MYLLICQCRHKSKGKKATVLLQVSFHYSKEVLYVATCETSYNDNKGIAFQYHTTPSDEDSTISGPVSLRSYLSVANYSDKKTKFSFPREQ